MSGRALAALALAVLLLTSQGGTVKDWLRRMLASATAARMGISNEPGPAELEALTTRTIPRVLVLAGAWPGLQVTSGYRSAELNRAVGGTPGSYHTQGRAADLALPTGRATEADARRAHALLEAAGLPSRVAWYSVKGHLHIDDAGSGVWRDDGRGWVRV